MTQIDYPYCPEGREYLYVDMHNPFMQAAYEMARDDSTDHVQSTGAVLVKDDEIIARSANQSRIKNKKLRELHKNGWCVRKRFKVATGTKYWMCPGCATHHEHSESRLEKEVKRLGLDAHGADVYLYGHWWCCKPCWDAMIRIGVKNVFLLKGSEYLFNPKSEKTIISKKICHV